MNKYLATMAAASVMAIASPAAAQYGSNDQRNYQGGNADANMSARIDQLQMRLQAGVQSGSISRAEAMPLRQQLRQLSQLERQYSMGGISGEERGELQRRMRSVRQAIRAADGNDQARWNDYDRQDGYGQYEQQYGNNNGYGSNNGYGGGNDRIDANRDGFDDRDYNRNGRWDDDSNNGNYAPPQQPARGGLGGIVDSLLGGGGLRVGQQAGGGLYGLPDNYRGQYRDSPNSYYRTDGRQIYQIDARTQAVVRVYPMNR